MTPSLRISQKLINRLANVNANNVGKIYGILAKNTLVVLALELELEDSTESDLINSFPAEIDVRGIISIGDGTYNDQTIKESLSQIYVTDNPLFINYKRENNDITTTFYVNSQLEACKFTPITEQDILAQFLYVRLLADVPLSCEVGPETIKDGFLNLRKSIASGVMAFKFSKNNVYLLGNDDENGVVGISGNPGVEELCDEITEPNEGAGRKKKVQCFDVDVINVRMFKKMTNGSVGGKGHAPVCALDKKQCKSLSLTITVDALSLLHRQTKVVNLYAVLVESAIRHLKLLEKAFLNNRELSQPQTFHFYPQECGHFVTKIYLKSNEEDSLLPERRKLHKQLLLDLARPQFRRNNKFGFKSENPNSGLLNNPHEGLKATDNGGKIALVKGKYAYYHYCQNKMDDNGWGCAYRSLQTLASWFKLQGYTDKDVPSFNDIQKCLVDIGDKPKNFIGSKQWIGSTEVNFVLNNLLGITCKILYVSSGEEMSSKGPELVSHFENHGSPVMIGGGVLAHTILGVDYNTQSGSIKFLILDPHYTGGEDLHTIQSKGWCGWKGVDFWDKTAYYNMCLPQVPVGI